MGIKIGESLGLQIVGEMQKRSASNRFFALNLRNGLFTFSEMDVPGAVFSPKVLDCYVLTACEIYRGAAIPRLCAWLPKRSFCSS